MAYIPNSNSVVAFQSDPTKLVGTMSVVGNMNSSVAVMSVVPHSVATLQGTNPWIVNVPTPSYISYQAAGSIMAISGSFSAGNTSVSGYIESTNTSIFTLLKNSSVTVLQGTNPWQVSTPTPSYISYQLAGSIMAVSATVNTGNSSVQLVSGTATIGSVVGIQGTNPYVMTGSVQGTMSVLGTVPVTQGTASNPWIITGSVQGAGAGTQYGENQQVASVTGTAVMFKSNMTTSILTVVTPATPLPTSVQGTVGINQGVASVMLFGSTNTSIVAVLLNSSVTTLQGTNPWIVNVPTPSYIAYQLAGSVMQVAGGGGGTQYVENNAVTASVTGNAILYKKDETNSVLSTVSPQHPLPVQGSVTALQGTNPWQVNMPSPSIVVIHPAGSVVQVRTDNASVIAVLTTSSVAVLQGTTPWLIGNSSVQLVAGTVAIGSVATLQGTNPWIVNVPTPSYISYQLAGSIMAVNTTVTTGPSSVQLLSTSASIVTTTNYGYSSVMLMTSTNASVVTAQLYGVSSVLLMSQSASIATLVNNILTGNSSVQLISTSASIMVNMKSQFGANNTWTQNNSVLATGGLRNDTMSSITTADSTYSPFAVGPIGETLVANSPITKWVSGATSVMYGTSVQVLAAPGASIFTYITGIHVINESATLSRVTITQGLGRVPASMVTWAIAPASGGSNMVFPNPLRILDNNGVSASISGISSVFVTIEGFTSKT